MARLRARKIETTHQPRLALRFDLNPPALADHEHELTSDPSAVIGYTMLSLPAYMVEQAGRLLELLRDQGLHKRKRRPG